MFQRAIRDREKNGSDDNMASGAFRRKLNTQVDADEFVENVLGILDDDGSQAAKIVCAELGLQVLEDSPTVSSKNYRVAKYRLQKDRKRLQDRILSELITMTQLENDDDICLGSGGAQASKPPGWCSGLYCKRSTGLGKINHYQYLGGRKWSLRLGFGSRQA